MAISENTKAQYRTSVRHIQRMEDELGLDISLPFTLGKTLNYVGFLLDERGCSAKTVGQYLSRIRMLHLCRGFDVASLRPPIVNMILKGGEHWDNINKTLIGKPKRVPVTIKVLKYLKRALYESNFGNEKKLRIWLICCVLWNGSLRVHEALSKTKSEFDPTTTLCAEDVEIVTFKNAGVEKALLRIHFKSPKERRG